MWHRRHVGSSQVFSIKGCLVLFLYSYFSCCNYVPRDISWSYKRSSVNLHIDTIYKSTKFEFYEVFLWVMYNYAFLCTCIERLNLRNPSLNELQDCLKCVVIRQSLFFRGWKGALGKCLRTWFCCFTLDLADPWMAFWFSWISAVHQLISKYFNCQNSAGTAIAMYTFLNLGSPKCAPDCEKIGLLSHDKRPMWHVLDSY